MNTDAYSAFRWLCHSTAAALRQLLPSEHEAAAFPRRLVAADGLPVGDHVEGDRQLPEDGHHVPVVLSAALDVRRPPGFLDQVADLLPVSDVTGVRRVVRVSGPASVGQGTVEADERRQGQDVAAAGHRQVVAGFRGTSGMVVIPLVVVVMVVVVPRLVQLLLRRWWCLNLRRDVIF